MKQSNKQTNKQLTNKAKQRQLNRFTAQPLNHITNKQTRKKKTNNNKKCRLTDLQYFLARC